ncbi:MAG TPA: DedA family protein/thiosulfate sulfurtransferase GlpE [Acidobacteriaceae bacterium]|nr:DedA family protein/thiosulfate sulfurtransferase GlpE [Acidobacteriaceae bacterium]
MHEVISFLTQHGYIALMALVFIEQIGVPLPAAPVLLAAGALSGTGLLNIWVSAASALVAALVSDTIWFQIGRIRGNTVLGLLCRISLEPASCARRTQNMFSKHGASSLLVAKFIPWLNTAASPLAGAFGMRFVTFLLFDTLGILLWVGAFLGLGYLFGNELDKIAGYVSKFGFLLLVILLCGALAAYLGLKYTRQQQFLRQLRMARITPEELKQKLDSNEEVAIVDLRHPLEFLPEPYSIPGSIRFPMEELERRNLEIPRDRDIVLYCTCPSEATSAMTAMRLRKFGITRVRPLAGGYFAWRKCGFPLEPHFGPVPPLRMFGNYTRRPVTP